MMKELDDLNQREAKGETSMPETLDPDNLPEDLNLDPDDL